MKNKSVKIWVAFTLVSLCLLVVLTLFLKSHHSTLSVKPVDPTVQEEHTEHYVEKDSTVKSPVLSAQELLAGVWSRLPDKRQLVKYFADGTAEVLYNGKKTDAFQWAIETEIKNVNINFSSQKGDLFIREYTASNANRYYKIQKLDSKNLVILYTYTDRVLEYQKVSE